MNLLLLCGIYPYNQKHKIMKDSKRGFQFAAQNFQEGIVDGFIKNDITLSIITSPFISSFPFGYKKAVFKSSKYIINEKALIEETFFLNIPFFRDIINITENKVMNYCKEHATSGKIHIMVYSLNSYLMNIALRAKKRFPNVVLSIIILDLPEFMGVNKVYRLLGLNEKSTKFIYSNLSKFDNYVLLTDKMADKLALRSRKTCVVEGIFNAPIELKHNQFEKLDTNYKYILYSGALIKKYGLDILLEAFANFPGSQYRLIICGDGEARDFVKEFSDRDSRIIFKGKVSREEVVEYQEQSDLLINPRGPEGEYTQYSFPSKTIEYLASGTPTMMHDLPGIPREYYNYCYKIEGNSAKDLTKMFIDFFQTPESEREQKGQAAQKFIHQNKCSKTQSKIILDLLNSQ